jgi:hypothetical protein
MLALAAHGDDTTPNVFPLLPAGHLLLAHEEADLAFQLDRFASEAPLRSTLASAAKTAARRWAELPRVADVVHEALAAAPRR